VAAARTSQGGSDQEIAQVRIEPNRSVDIPMYIALQPLVALIAGILILMIPRLLNYIVALYLIVTGILGIARM
jgi:hypothetical protein